MGQGSEDGVFRMYIPANMWILWVPLQGQNSTNWAVPPAPSGVSMEELDGSILSPPSDGLSWVWTKDLACEENCHNYDPF